MLAALLASAGVLVERWLFFAEARHSVMLYYGARTVRWWRIISVKSVVNIC